MNSLEIAGAIASIAGIVLGLPALVLALIQLRRTKKAAEAAAASAMETLQRVSNVVAVASIEQICSRSKDLLHLVRARDLSASATAAFELRDALCKFSKSTPALHLQDEQEWMCILDTVSEIHNDLECASAIKKIDAKKREGIIQGIALVHSRLSMLAAIAGEKAGGLNAYSK